MNKALFLASLASSVVSSVITTPVTDQGYTLQCWAVASVSKFDFVASQTMGFALKLSPKYTVYTKTLGEVVHKVMKRDFEKYQGQLCENCKAESIYYEQGGIFPDAVEAAKVYGVVPEAVYSGFPSHDEKLFRRLNTLIGKYAEGKLKATSEKDVATHVEEILDEYLGKPPRTFDFEGRKYDPRGFFALVLPGWDHARARELTFAPGARDERTTVKAYDDASYDGENTGDQSRIMQVIEASLKAGEPVLVQYKVIDEDHTQQHGRIGFAIHGVPFPRGGIEKVWNDGSVLDHYVLAIGAQWSDSGHIEKLLIKNTWGTSSEEGLGFHWIEPDYFPLFEGVELAD